MDDTSFLEVLNLISVGLVSLNPKTQVPSDVPPQMAFLPPQNCNTQSYLNKMAKWTSDQKMKLNPVKSKYMIVNYCSSLQFRTRLTVNNSLIDQVHVTRLLGLLISDDMSWKVNSQHLIKRAYSRMIILRKLVEFNVKHEDMITIYILYIRSVIEQSSVVWSSSLTSDEISSFERCQKVALRVIFQHEYISYENAIKQAKIPKMCDRFEALLLRFAIKCTKNPKTQDLLPLVKKSGKTRPNETYEVPMARKSRFFHSTVPTMARMMNKYQNQN